MKTHTLKRSPATMAAVVLLGAASLAFMSCYYVPGFSGSKARAGLVLPRAIPVNTTSVALVVEGPGMDTLSTSYTTIPASISIEVPPGLARTFTLLLNSPSATLLGVATADLQPGETKDINLTPTLAATQIVIPDPLNGRIVQISDMNGTGWIAKTVADFGGTGTFNPYGIDFDNQGRIHIANNSANSIEPLGGVNRIDDINHTSSFVLVDDTKASGIKSLAVDRTHGLIYYITGSTILYQKDVNNIAASATQITLSPEIGLGPISIAVDDQGILYMTIPGSAGPGYVVKYNPTLALQPRVVANSSPGYTSSAPWGVMVKGPYVYVSDSGAGKIVRFDKNLQFVDSFSGASGDAFTRPETFLATLNRKITVIDEGGAVDRLASFDDMTGAGWTTFYAASVGQSAFTFYSFC